MAAETVVSVTLTGDEYQALMGRVEKAERDAAESDAMNSRLAHESFHLEFANKALQRRIEALRKRIHTAYDGLAAGSSEDADAAKSGPSAPLKP